MPRSSTADPIEKFRFRVSVVALNASLEAAAVTVTGAAGITNIPFAVLSRAGFSEVGLPEMRMGEILYRENVDAQRFSRIPGLARYEPVTLRRGVTANRDLYNWIRQVNDEIALTAAATELGANPPVPPQDELFRKDVIIEALDRTGQPVKAWYLFNAWPNRYKPGDSFDSASDEKLIEELSLTYEFFLELEGGAEGLATELARGALSFTANQLKSSIAPFLR